MNVFKLILNALGIGKDYLENRAKKKLLKQQHEYEILKATTTAEVERIKQNTSADNDIDLITVKQHEKTYKDDIVTYLFLTPFVTSLLVPFLIAFKNSDWINLNYHIKDSFETLNQLPTWYKYGLAAVVVSVLGFRSFLREIFNKYKKDI